MPITIENSEPLCNISLTLDTLDSCREAQTTELTISMFGASGNGVPFKGKIVRVDESGHLISFDSDKIQKIALNFRGELERDSFLLSLYKTLNFYFNNKNNFKTTLFCTMFE